MYGGISLSKNSIYQTDNTMMIPNVGDEVYVCGHTPAYMHVTRRQFCCQDNEMIIIWVA